MVANVRCFDEGKWGVKWTIHHSHLFPIIRRATPRCYTAVGWGRRLEPPPHLSSNANTTDTEVSQYRARAHPGPGNLLHLLYYSYSIGIEHRARARAEHVAVARKAVRRCPPAQQPKTNDKRDPSIPIPICDLAH
eukprot:scaffold9366_cov118-Isochrysis_galbana.AAC.1